MLLNKKLIISVLLLFFTSKILDAQTPQDCKGAIPVCQTTYSQSTSYTGTGSLNELNASNQGCLTTGENNSVWYIINVSSSGSLTFTLTPNTSTNDYDFAVWDITDKSCADVIGGLAPLRCNYASIANSSPGGLTGLSTTSSTASIGAAGPSFSSAINATAGQTFIILINNSSASATGYNLNFGGTAVMNDNTVPTVKADTLAPGCNNPSYITLLLTENIKCSSLALNGSDFTLTPAVTTISGVSSISCSGGGSFTNLIKVNFSSPLPPGNYSLKVVNGTDGNTLIDNCNNSMPVNTNIGFVVQQPVQLSLNTVFGCANSNTGVITATGQFGSSPYQFKLNNGSFASNNVFSGLSAGTYTISIKDANGCIDDSVVTLVQGVPIVISNLLITNPLCFGQTTGSVTVTASGGNPPLTYAINTGPFQSGNTLGSLGPGNFIVKVKDANGCIKDSVIFISAPGQLSFPTLTKVNASCGQNNGSISATGFGGTPPLTYSLNNGPAQSTGNFLNLAAGTYTLKVKDANNCFKDTVLNINQISSVVINSVSKVQPTCSGSNGSLTVSASGGTSPLTYKINGSNFGSSNSFTGLSSGTYTITVKDANGCTVSSVSTLNSTANLYFSSATITQPTCITMGSISTTGAGGSNPLTYSLNTGPYSGTNNWNNLAAGSYTIHLKDGNGCLHDTVITLSIASTPNFTSVPKTNASCSNPNGGSITVNVNGGTPAYSYSFNGGPGGSTSSWSNLSGGIYTIVVSDANGCSINTTVTITSANTVNFATFTSTDVGCQGSPLGTISSSGTGGNNPYTFSLNGAPFQSSGNYTGLAGGTYTVIVKDASGCTKSSVTTIQASGTVTLNSVSFTNSPCVSPATGTITVVGTVSIPNIQYNLNPGPSNTTGNFNNLAPGTYTVIVKDGQGCTVTSTVTLAAPPPLYFINVVVVDPPCYGGVGSISVQGGGGNPPYQFKFGTGNYGSVSSWNNLPGGTYSVKLKDANGCVKDTNITILEPPKIDIVGLVLSSSSCNSAPTGSATITATGGTPPFKYSINNGPFSTNNIFNNLAGGTHTITVKDDNGCTEDTVINILSNGNFFITNVTRVKPSCYGGNDGSITFTVSGGTSPFQYKLNTGAYQSGNTFNGLSAGTYTLKAKDNGGCIDDSIFTLTQPPQLVIASLVKTNPSCHNGTDGQVVISGSGGTPAYTYSANNGPFGSSTTLSNLSVGNNTISIKDSKGCQKDTVINLQNPPKLWITNLSVVSPGCLGGGGVVSYLGLGGTGPYTYSKNGVNYVSTGQFGSLPSGTYTFYVKDSKGCTHDTTITISGTAAITLNSLSNTKYLCVGSNNGTINVSATSANLPMIYQLNGGPTQTGGNFSNLNVGTYTLHIQDNQGCYVDSVISILQAPLIKFDSVMVVNSPCANVNGGSIKVYAKNAVQPYNYRLNLNAYQLSNAFNNLNPATYTVRVRDSVGCTKDTIVTVSSPPPIVVNSINLIKPFCSNATDGQITINVQGGLPPYQYAINTSLYTTNNVFSNLIQGIYTVHIVDANNCSKDTVVNLTANNYMQFTNLVITNVSCVNGNNGGISLGTSGGTLPYSYSINNIPNGGLGVFTNLGSGTYTIVVTDNIGCQNDTVLTITQPPNALHPQLLNMTPNLCKGDSSGSISMGAFGGTPSYQYSLDGITFQNNGNFGGFPAGIYQVFVKDANGCLNDTLVEVMEPDTSVQIALVNVTPQSCKDVNDGTITVKANYGFPAYTFFLDGVLVGSDTFYNNLPPGDYVVEVIDAIGCKSTGKYTVAGSAFKPIISIDSSQGVTCFGDKDGYIVWHGNTIYPPITNTFNGNNLGSTNAAFGLSNGSYLIQIEDSKGCKADSLVTLTASNPIEVNVTTTPAACDGYGDDGGAKATVLGGLSPFSFYWSSTPFLNGDTIYPVKYGTYFAIVTDSLNCKDTVNYTVDYEPCCIVTLPNAFSPNGDGLNEIFRPIKYGIITLESFEIYNRWGNKVFETKILGDGWNGTYKNLPADLGAYFYRMTYKCHLNDKIEVKQGDVILIR